MILRNPTGRAIRLEILTGDDDAAMALTIGAHATVDMAKYQRALETLAWVNQGVPVMGDSDDSGAPQ